MDTFNRFENFETENKSMDKVCKLKKYTQPELRKFGAMQKITLSGSTLNGDSGNGLIGDPFAL